MAKVRNTVAKLQREVDKKRKADQKRERRARKKQIADESCEPNEPQSLLSKAENSVLRIFRKYLMTPGNMLCLGRSDLEALRLPLSQLTNEGLLVAERYEGGYSLTEVGFAAMKGSAGTWREDRSKRKNGQHASH